MTIQLDIPCPRACCGVVVFISTCPGVASLCGGQAARVALVARGGTAPVLFLTLSN